MFLEYCILPIVPNKDQVDRVRYDESIREFAIDWLLIPMFERINTYHQFWCKISHLKRDHFFKSLNLSSLRLRESPTRNRISMENGVRCTGDQPFMVLLLNSFKSRGNHRG